MKKFTYLSLILILILYISLLGCGNSKSEKAQSELKELNKKHQLALSENTKLSNEIERLQKENKELRIKNEMLANKQEDLKEWSEKLVEGYGTGIWYIDKWSLPIFVKSMPSADVNKIIEELNLRFAKDSLPRIIFKKIKNKTVYVGLDNDDLLTQRMGSYGAATYLNSVTYSIASVKGINCVWFEFEEGDHAIPGEYCR